MGPPTEAIRQIFNLLETLVSHSAYTVASFLLGAAKASQFPPDQGAEVAFAGRSNAGKSSALNALSGRQALARTSKTPGRTREINFFSLDQERRLVDLPGYGYASVPERIRRQWGETIDRYLEQRRCLKGVVLVMDIRHPLREFDLRLVDLCEARQMPLHLLLTKADKLSRGAASGVLEQLRGRYRTRQGDLSVQLFSALKRNGVDELARRLDAWYRI